MKFLFTLFISLFALSASANVNIELIKSHILDGDKKIEVLDNKDTTKKYTPAYVNFNFSENKCNVFKNDTTKYDFLKDKKLVDFMFYHELGHCDLYFTGFYKNTKNQELILSETLTYQTEMPYLFLLFHEMYADSFAFLFMKKDGYKLKEIEKIITFRSKTEMLGTHQTSKFLEKIKTYNIKNKSDLEIKNYILTNLEIFFEENWIEKRYPYQMKSIEDMNRTISSSYLGFLYTLERLKNNEINNIDEKNYYITIINSIKNGVANQNNGLNNIYNLYLEFNNK